MVHPRHRPTLTPDHPKNVATLLQSDLKLTCIRRTDRCMRCTSTGSSGECILRKSGGHTSLTNSIDDQRMIIAYTIGSSDERVSIAGKKIQMPIYRYTARHKELIQQVPRATPREV